MLREKAPIRIRPGWHGRAFLVEALILLALIIGSLAVVMNVYVKAHDEGADGMHLTSAIQLAQNAAEEFAADPSGTSNLQLEQDELVANVQVESEQHAAGMLYYATIVVQDSSGETLYSLDTARYKAGDEGSAADTGGTSANDADDTSAGNTGGASAKTESEVTR